MWILQWDSDDKAPDLETVVGHLQDKPRNVRIRYISGSFAWVRFVSFDGEKVTTDPDKYGCTTVTPENLWGIEPPPGKAPPGPKLIDGEGNPVEFPGKRRVLVTMLEGERELWWVGPGHTGPRRDDTYNPSCLALVEKRDGEEPTFVITKLTEGGSLGKWTVLSHKDAINEFFECVVTEELVDAVRNGGTLYL